MEVNENVIESLLVRAEEYTNTSVNLLKLKFIDKTIDSASIIFTHLISIVILFFFVLTLTVSTSLWIGELLGKTYYGFLIVSGFYGLLWVIVFCIQSLIKKRFKNALIHQLLN